MDGTIKNLTNNLTLQERQNQGFNYKRYDNQYQPRFWPRNNLLEQPIIPKPIDNVIMAIFIEGDAMDITKWFPSCSAPHFLDSYTIYQH